MQLSGSHVFKAPRSAVWDALTDPETLKKTLPGCQKFERMPDGSYAVTMSIGIAAIKGTYTGTVHLLNEREPESYTLKMSARGGVGFVDGHGDFVLADENGEGEGGGGGGGGTLLTYTGDAQVGGKIAGVGQRLLHAGANLVIGQFFKAVEKEIGRAAPHEEGTAVEPDTARGSH